MGKFTTGQIEKISTSALNLLLCNFENVDPNINWNDKEPSWDGAIYLYEGNSHKKSLLKGKIPVQVKGTEVKKNSRKFVSFNISLSDIKNYYYDGGALFFVIEIVSTKQFKIFYKFLLPIDLKNLMEEITERGLKSKSVHIDNILDEKSKFNKECEEFLTHRHRQSINTVEQAVSLDDIKGKSIEFIGDKNPLNMINKDVYFYTKDEFGVYIPIKDQVTLKAFAYKVERDLIIDSKKYFDNFQLVNYEDEEIQIIGDGLEHNITNGKITIKNSTKDIVSRLNTLEFIEKLIDSSKKEQLKKELSIIGEQNKLILRLIDVCKNFNIPAENIKLSEMTINDGVILKILENIKTFSQVTKLTKEVYTPSIIRVDFFGYKILLLCIENEVNKYYSDYFEEEENFDLIHDFGYESISMGRFSILKDIDLLAFNFNVNIVKSSIKSVIKRCKEEDKNLLSEQYTLLALESMKAWDISNNNIYLDLANYILDEFKDYLSNDILIINRAQIEKRIVGKLSGDTMDNLYKIKFNKDEKDKDYYETLTAISILLEDEEKFNDNFEKVNDKKIFMDYPIYTLYSKTEK